MTTNDRPGVILKLTGLMAIACCAFVLLVHVGAAEPRETQAAPQPEAQLAGQPEAPRKAQTAAAAAEQPDSQTAAGAKPGPLRPVAVVCLPEAAFVERLAAAEIRRYIYVCTGRLLPIVDSIEAAPPGDLIVVALSCSTRLKGLGLSEVAALSGEEVPGIVGDWYLLKTIEHRGRRMMFVRGGWPAGPLYGAYRLVERLGVRFYLHGDVVPDEPVEPSLSAGPESGEALFDLRGIQPFHDFPEGPDWWDAQAYKAVLAQLPKLGMNFFGLHTYPQGGVGPEPTVWIGLPGEFDAQGRVKAGYASRHFLTSNATGSWGYRPAKTSHYVFGAAALYEVDDYGPDYMRIRGPWNQMKPEECNALFNRFGTLLKESFTFARQLGIKTCIGTETPLVVPSAVRERLAAAGKDPKDPAVVRELYEGMFARIKATHPLDYYWFWTPEGWTWSGVKQAQIDATLADLRLALEAARNVKAPFRLATCGWVLGPPQDRALFDKELPKEMAVSCINRQVGHAPVEPGFAQVEGRHQWAIPWLEDDPALIIPQLWVGRMRKDAADALAYGCTGLMGIHWRTRILGPNVAALARAGWDQASFNPELGGKLPQAAAQLPEGPDGGKHAQFPNNQIEATEDDALYQTVRYDVAAYRFDLPNGRYAVTLKFCEPHYTQSHQRVFGVKLQGKRVIDSLDLIAQVGRNKALDRTFNDVEVRDGRLVIEFVYQVEFPCIAAIAVEGDKATRKINCGGPAWGDYAADWPPSERAGASNRFLRCDDFYADWARTQFGPEAAREIAALFTRIDGHLPRPSTWVRGPGGIKPDPHPWQEVRVQYAFVEELQRLAPRVRGPGNRQRFDYWLNQLRYLREVGHVNCLWHQYNQIIQQVKAEKDEAARRRLARQRALPARVELVRAVAEVHRLLLSTVSTPGGLGTVTNWQQHLLPDLLEKPGAELAGLLGEPLPPEAQPARDYAGPPRLFVPVVRTILVEGEPLPIKAVVLGGPAAQKAVAGADARTSGVRGAERPAVQVTLHWRRLGSGEFAAEPMKHLARGVYQLDLPPEACKADLEYYVEARWAANPLAQTSDPAKTSASPPDSAKTIAAPPGRAKTGGSSPGRTVADAALSGLEGATARSAKAAGTHGLMLRFPATAPRVNQTVVVVSAQ